MPAPPQVKMRGYEGQLYYTPPGGTEAIFANVSDIEISAKADSIDFSDHSTQGWKDLGSGMIEWSGTVKALAIQGGVDTTQLYAALSGAQTLTLSFRPQDITGGLNYTGSCSVMSFKASAANSGPQSIDITLSGRSPLVLGTVAVAGS